MFSWVEKSFRELHRCLGNEIGHLEHEVDDEVGGGGETEEDGKPADDHQPGRGEPEHARSIGSRMMRVKPVAPTAHSHFIDLAFPDHEDPLLGRRRDIIPAAHAGEGREQPSE